ncbi:MAG: hypothetical protein LBR67_02775 [Dysgonamonadaceae bacterium]|nr:hypothetical protein [Dysgonamonadaceae bacterium]
MKKIIFCITIPLMIISCVMSTPDRSVKVVLQPSTWEFDFSRHASIGTLNTTIRQANLPVPEQIEQGFTVRFSVDVKSITNDEMTLLEIPEVLKVKLRMHDPNLRDGQNYPAYAMPDGSVPVLEASLGLKFPENAAETKEMTIGIPLAMLETPYGKHDIVLNFTGVKWTMYVDGKLLDNDFALGYPQWTTEKTWNIIPDAVSDAAIYFPVLLPQQQTSQTPETVPEIQYWTPSGHNAWVGDVVSFYHEGRYHIFYLYDRRHHQSKFGRGAHYFEHLSTTDFKTWTEHEAATPIEEQWETFGTGTPFVWGGKFCISYGYHTTRIYPREQTALPEQWNFLKVHGYTGAFNRNNITGFPAGSSYSVSDDGLSGFRKTGILFHPCENPSVYIDPNGKLKLLANYQSKGIWESESIDSGWRCVNPDFPPGGDCTFFFRWGEYDYIIGGFNGLWSKPASSPDTDYESLVEKGLDFYNGMCVPSITPISDGRYLMAAWMNVRGWGGPLIIHELVQLPEGRVGTKWMEEIIPTTGNARKLASKVTETTVYPSDVHSFMLTFRVNPVDKGGKIGLVFLGDEGGRNACELQIDLSELRAQYADGSMDDFAPGNEKSPRQGAGGAGFNYAIENLIGVNKPFTVRVIVKCNAKLGGSFIDAEIAGKRTMLSYRPDLYIQRLLFRTDGIKISDVGIAPLINN